MAKNGVLGNGAEGKAKQLTFSYVARGSNNRTLRGTVQAASEADAQSRLIGRGYIPLSIEPTASPWSLEGAIPSLFAVKPRQVITFSRQLATLLESGVTLLAALQLLEAQATDSAAMRRIVATVAQDVGTGKSFAQALTRHPHAFSEMYVRTVGIGERMGQLQVVLRQMAEHLEKQSAFSRKVSGALTYPIILLVVGLVVTIILLVVALPPLTDLFRTLEVDLPLPTRILLGISAFIHAYSPYVFATLGTVTVAGVWTARRPRGRRALDRLRLTAPLIGLPAHTAELGRICRTMALLLSAGLSLQEIMDLLPQTTRNTVLQDALNQVTHGLLLGQGLATPMSSSPLFPLLMRQMVYVGEESNSLEESLTVLANFYESTAEEKTARLLALLQPVSTIVIGGVAALIALSVVMPMYQLTGALD